ncbi:MAG: hypothetical protein QOK47_1540 [Actinomycetota bacterium]|nr:hypothetical protein [Actinomycetota bacterium]
MSVTETRPEAPKTTRCPSCGGLNPASAQWCGQCLTQFAPPAPPPPPPARSGSFSPERPKARVSPLLTGADPETDTEAPAPFAVPAEGITKGAFRVTEAGILWRCSACDTENPLESEICSASNTPIRQVLQSGSELPQRDPNKTAMYSLFMPGAGHAYLGLWGQAIARGVLSLWVIFTAIMGAMQRRGGTVIAIVFGLAAFGLWITAAHDAYWEAQGKSSRALLKGKMYVYIVLGLLMVLLVLLVGAGFAARSQGA